MISLEGGKYGIASRAPAINNEKQSSPAQPVGRAAAGSCPAFLSALCQSGLAGRMVN